MSRCSLMVSDDRRPWTRATPEVSRVLCRRLKDGEEDEMDDSL